MEVLAELCKKIITGKVGIIDACRQVHELSVKLRVESDDDFSIFKEITAEAADLGIGRARAELEPTALQANDAKVKQIEDANRIKVILAATWLEGRIREHGEASEYQDHAFTGIDVLDDIAGKLMAVSIATQGRPASWRTQQASLAFAKVSINALTLLRLIPHSPHFTPVGKHAVWDLSTIATQCRCIMEAYYVLVYLVHEPTDPEVQKFHQLLWQYHEQYERCEVVKASLPDSKQLPAALAELAGRKIHLENSPVFKGLKPNHQRDLLKGSAFKLQYFPQLNQMAGISDAYFRAEYKYCSNFAHCAPFAVASMNAFRADNSEGSKSVIGHLVSLANGYCALALREFIKMFPDQSSSLSDKHKDLIHAWEMLMMWENNPYREGASPTVPEAPKA